MLKIKWLFNYLFSLENMSYVCYTFVYLKKESENLFFLGKKRKFYVFLGRQGICPRSYVSFSEIRKWDLRSLLGRKHFVCWVDFIFIYIYIFFFSFCAFKISLYPCEMNEFWFLSLKCIFILNFIFPKFEITTQDTLHGVGQWIGVFMV